MTKSICVVGLGYIGLPTAVMFANHGIKVHGVDVNPAAVKSIQEKKTSYRRKWLAGAFEQSR